MITSYRRHYSLKKLSKVKRLVLVTFFIAFASASIGTIWSIYIKSFVGSDSATGFVIAFLAVISLISYIFSVPIIERFDKSKLFKTVILLIGGLYFLLAINKFFFVFLFLAALTTVLITIKISTFGIIIKEKSADVDISKNEGLIYTFLNIAWVIGPLVAGFIAMSMGNSYVLIFSSLLLFLTFLLFEISDIKDTHRLKKIEKNVLKNAVGFFKQKDNVVAYFLGGGVNFWWILVLTFIPLLIVNSGLGKQYIGYFIFMIGIPLIILEYPISKLVGKISYKLLFKLGYIIPCVISIICFFVPNIYAIMGLLVISSIGLAMIEPTTEAYFLRLMKHKQEMKFYEIYNTAMVLHVLLASLLSSIILLVFPFKFLFLFYGLFMFLFFMLSFRAKNLK